MRIRNHIKMPSILLLLMLIFAPASAQNTPFRIVTTTTQASDLMTILTANVPEGVLEITGLMGAGVDPHLYKPTASDVEAMNNAQLIVYSGLHLEGQFDVVFASLSQRGVAIHRLSQPIEDAGFVLQFEAEGVVVDDPHFWFDPRNWALTTTALADLLATLEPTYADTYRANAESYVEQLDLFYEWGIEAMFSVPEELRYIVTSHDAFRYFGDAFGWTMVAVQGISTESEVGVGDIQSVVNFVAENDIPVIFVESSVSPATIQAVQDAVRSRGKVVELGVRELYSDAMGNPDDFGGTYIGMMASNIYTILQSYKLAGIALTIPAWDERISPTPPDDMVMIEG